MPGEISLAATPDEGNQKAQHEIDDEQEAVHEIGWTAAPRERGLLNDDLSSAENFFHSDHRVERARLHEARHQTDVGRDDYRHGLRKDDQHELSPATQAEGIGGLALSFWNGGQPGTDNMRSIGAAPKRATTQMNETWAMDFVHDQLASGRKIRVLTVVDIFSRFSPTVDPRFSYRGE